MSEVHIPRRIAWFSCGGPSACAAKLAVDQYGPENVIVANCDMTRDEHFDNVRFFHLVQAWIGVPILRLHGKYASVDEVFEKTRYMSGMGGARCTVEMKKKPRLDFQRPDDIHIFGFTAEEWIRMHDFKMRNPEMKLEWILAANAITRADCDAMLKAAGIELPAMYRMGYANNNCLGCVKATGAIYWNKIRRDFPAVFAKRAMQSRELGVRLVRIQGVRLFLDEMPPDTGQKFYHGKEGKISCGPECAGETNEAPTLTITRHANAGSDQPQLFPQMFPADHL